jgi:N-acetylglucosaminyl-diphospho-decaprenol L-rhamnosyltransferase
LSATDVTVSVVTFNSADVLPGLLSSLPSGLDGLSWRLVVADNDSVDDTVAVVGQLMPDATIVRMGCNAGYAAGVNAAIAAGGEAAAFLVLNPDVRLGQGSVRRLLSALDEPGVGIAVPRLSGAQGQLIPSLRREPSLLRALADATVGAERAGRWGTLGEVITNPADYLRPRTADWAEGSTQLVGASCLRACGPWDESYFLYSEETDFHLRARDAGFALRFVPDATAEHLEGDSAASPRLWALLTANRVMLFGRRHGVAATWAYRAILMLREGSRSLLGRATSRAAFRVLASSRMCAAPRGPEWLDRVR